MYREMFKPTRELGALIHYVSLVLSISNVWFTTVCVRVCPCASVHEPMCTCLFVCAHMYMCVRVCMCLHMCVSACVHVRARVCADSL